MQYAWMDYVEKATGCRISPKMNTGYEITGGPFFLDGLDVERPVVYEYDGCIYPWHENCIKGLKILNS